MKISAAVALIALPWVGVLAGWGCTPAPPDSYPGFEHRGAVLQEELRIDPYEEDLVPIGAVAEREGDGVVAFIQSQDGMVRLYSAEGERIGTFGRQGDGPGEFRSPRALGWWADTLWVFDGRHGRVTAVTPELERARTIHVGHVPGFFLAIGPGEAVNAVRTAPSEEGLILRMGPEESEPAHLLPVPATEGGNVRAADGGVIYSLPFMNGPQHASSTAADRVAVAMASLDGPDAGSFTVTMVDLEGQTLFDRRYGFTAKPLPATLVTSERERAAAPYDGRAPAMAAAAREQPVPSLYPPFRDLFIGDDGSIWVEQRDRDEGRPYYVIAPDGEPAGTVLVSEETRILAGTMEHVWARETDELGMQSLVRYSVSWE